MEDWMNRMAKGHIKPKKKVGEYLIRVKIIPDRRFGIKVFQVNDNYYEGITSITIADKLGAYYGICMEGRTVEEVINRTVEYLYKVIGENVESLDNKIGYMDFDMY